MIDENRLNRVHIVNVRSRKETYFIVLSDGSEIPWNSWTIEDLANLRGISVEELKRIAGVAQR